MMAPFHDAKYERLLFEKKMKQNNCFVAEFKMLYGRSLWFVPTVCRDA